MKILCRLFLLQMPIWYIVFFSTKIASEEDHENDFISPTTFQQSSTIRNSIRIPRLPLDDQRAINRMIHGGVTSMPEEEGQTEKKVLSSTTSLHTDLHKERASDTLDKTNEETNVDYEFAIAVSQPLIREATNLLDATNRNTATQTNLGEVNEELPQMKTRKWKRQEEKPTSEGGGGGGGADPALVKLLQEENKALRARLAKFQQRDDKEAATDSQNVKETSSNALDADSPIQKRKKPSLIIHIGPSKTGTTTIQKDSASLVWEEALAKDGYVYLGREGRPIPRLKANIPFLFDYDDCFKEAAAAWKNGTTTHFRQTPCWAERTAGLEEHLKNHHSIVLSDEIYSYQWWYYKDKDVEFYKLLKKAFQDWNVLIVGTYRRYHEWLLSGVKELNRQKCLQAYKPDPAGQWPQQEGKPCVNHWLRMQDIMKKHPEDYRGISYTNLDVSLPMWRDAGFDVQVLNFHSPQHITCSLYCDIIPDTPHTCQQCQEQQQLEGTHHNSHSVELTAYNDIVYHAANRGLFSNHTLQHQSRANVTAQLANYHTVTLGKQGLRDLPLVCPRKANLEALLKRSLAFERLILKPDPDPLANPEEWHQKSFWEKTRYNRELCWVHRPALWQNNVTSWQQLLNVLNTTQEWGIWSQRVPED